MQILSIPSIFLFFYKFFPFFFCKEGLKDIQPPQNVFDHSRLDSIWIF
jgi:hypothetical protein